MDNPKNIPNILSLCTGYGGIERGLEAIFGAIRVLAHVEIEAYAIANLVAKMETGQMVPAPVWTNLKTFRPAVFRNCVDILTGGYPCQPFSAAGKRKGIEDPRHIWPWIRSAIKVIRPSICFFENVEGHISLGLREVLTDLAELGYRVEGDSGEPTWGLFSAAEVGAPHQRKRVFILAYNHAAVRHGKEWAEWQSRCFSVRCRERVDDPMCGRYQHPEKEVCSRWDSLIDAGQGVGLADSCQPGLQGGKRTRSHEKRTTTYGAVTQCRALWPARPGEPQHEWEEPRVVNTKRPVRRRSKQKDDPGRRLEEVGRSDRTNGQVGSLKPQLGGAINGAAHRVDRLRLLGNGVVPQVAEKAFITLMGRVLNEKNDYVQPSIELEMFG